MVVSLFKPSKITSIYAIYGKNKELDAFALTGQAVFLPEYRQKNTPVLHYSVA